MKIIELPHRPINGILLANKSPAISSNAFLQTIKRLYKATKAGHTGSLDPLATGMLPICFGEATKFGQFLLNADKCYEAKGLLGIRTDTGDATGKILAKSPSVCVSHAQLLEVCEQFVGLSKQIPSMFSALKYHGTPLYHYARKGIHIDRQPREIVISNLKLLEFTGNEFTIRVTCSKGTYIRNLIEDIGERLGVGAHVLQLHRLHVGLLSKERMYKLEELIKLSAANLMNCLLPPDKAVEELPLLVLDNDHIQALCHGKVVNTLAGLNPGYVRLYSQKEQFIGVGEIKVDGGLVVKRLFSHESIHY